MKVGRLALLAAMPAVLLATVTAGASGILSEGEMRATSGGCGGYAQCVPGYDKCNWQMDYGEEGSDCNHTCTNSKNRDVCAGPLAPQYCHTVGDTAGCGFKYDRGIVRGHHCIPDDQSRETEIPCPRLYCDTTP